MIETVLERIAVALEAIAAGGGSVAGSGTTATKTTLEEVQDKIRALVAADEGNAAKVKAEIKTLGGQRAGDFEGDAAKLGKLLTALEGIEGGAAAGDDDLL